MHAQGQRQTGTWHRRRRDAGRALSLPRAPAQRDLVAGGTARQHGAAAVIRHSKTPTSSALAREPRRRLLAAHVRDCSRPRLVYSERTPSVPRCQYLRGAYFSAGESKRETADARDEIDEHWHGQEEG